jgi:hypothetical protein
MERECEWKEREREREENGGRGRENENGRRGIGKERRMVEEGERVRMEG